MSVMMSLFIDVAQELFLPASSFSFVWMMPDGHCLYVTLCGHECNHVKAILSIFCIFIPHEFDDMLKICHAVLSNLHKIDLFFSSHHRHRVIQRFFHMLFTQPSVRGTKRIDAGDAIECSRHDAAGMSCTLSTRIEPPDLAKVRTPFHSHGRACARLGCNQECVLAEEQPMRLPDEIAEPTPQAACNEIGKDIIHASGDKTRNV